MAFPSEPLRETYDGVPLARLVPAHPRRRSEPVRSSRSIHLMVDASLISKRSAAAAAHAILFNRVKNSVAQIVRIGFTIARRPPPSPQVESKRNRFGNPMRFRVTAARSNRAG